jgi:SAM-dependent methyltransferase
MNSNKKEIDFDNYVTDYETIINRHARLAGGSLEHFIGVRLGIVAELWQNRTRPAEIVNIVDFGCGIGVTQVQMARVFPRSQIVGLDVSAASISAAQKRCLDRVSFKTIEPGGALPFANNSVDLVYSNGTFHHIPHRDHQSIFSEIYRIMRPDASMFIFENNVFNPMTVYAMRQNPFDVDACLIAPPRMKRRILAAGFIKIRQGYYCFFPKPLTFLRFAERHLRWFPLGAQYYTWAIKP